MLKALGIVCVVGLVLGVVGLLWGFTQGDSAMGSAARLWCGGAAILFVATPALFMSWHLDGNKSMPADVRKKWEAFDEWGALSIPVGFAYLLREGKQPPEFRALRRAKETPDPDQSRRG